MNTVAISFSLYTVVIAIIGTCCARYAGRSESEFLLAERGLGAWVAALSAAASAESGWVTMGLVGFAFETGLAAFWVVPGTVAAFLFNWFVLAPRLSELARRHDALTIPELLGCRFRGRGAWTIRCVAAIIVLILLTAYIAAQLNAAGKTFHATFRWSYGAGVWFGAGIVLVYTITGGFRAIAWTDVIQATLMIATVTVVPVLLLYRLGGLQGLLVTLRQLDDSGALVSPWAGRSGWSLVAFFGLWFGIPLGNPGQPHVMVRLMAVRDRQAILRGGVISTLWVLVLFTGAVLLGVTARAHFGTLTDPEQALPRLATDANLVHGIVGGMIVAAILAAICSTADSQLLVAGSSVSRDLASGLAASGSSPARAVIWSRLAVLLVGLIATSLALAKVRSVFDFVLDYGWAGLGAALGPSLILVVLWRRMTAAGTLSAIVTGFTVAILWRQFPWLQQHVYNLVPAFCCALLAGALVSLRGRGERPLT